MKLTNREKILLIILGCVSVIALSWFLLFQPQLVKLKALESENAELKKEKTQVDTFSDIIKKLDRSLSQMLSDTEKKSSRFFPDIQQDRLILMLDDVFKKSQLQSLSITFKPVVLTDFKITASSTSKTTANQFALKNYVDSFNAINGESASTGKAANTQTAGNSNAGQNQTQAGNQVETMNITIQFKGSYIQLMNFIKGIEGLNRAITIEKLTSDAQPGGIIKGSIILNFYGVPKFENQDKEFMNWPIKNDYGKENPF